MSVPSARRLSSRARATSVLCENAQSATSRFPVALSTSAAGAAFNSIAVALGSPTVVLESGLDTYGSLAWASVHDSIAATTRVCAYSRAGIMWSDPASGPLE